MKFDNVAAGEWVQPVRKGYRMACCDCGLVHRIDFRLVKYSGNKRKIQLRAFRDQEATGALRSQGKQRLNGTV